MRNTSLSRLNSRGQTGSGSQKVSLGVMTSTATLKSTGDVNGEKERQKRNRENLEKRLDEIRSSRYNGRRVGDSQNFFGDVTMAGRRASIDKGTFVRVYSTGCKAGKTNEEIAVELGMEPNSCTTKASQLRKELREKHGVALPYPAGKTRKTVDNPEFLELLKGLEKVEPETDSEVTE